MGRREAQKRVNESTLMALKDSATPGSSALTDGALGKGSTVILFLRK